jgi:hypothetical protein
VIIIINGNSSITDGQPENVRKTIKGEASVAVTHTPLSLTLQHPHEN